MKVKRNNYIDFVRALAALSVIAIHTAFKSGTSYTPEWFRNLTLLIDVPLFFYLSGWAASYKKASIQKTSKSLLKLWMKWATFITITVLVCLLSQMTPYKLVGVYDIKDYINNLMFRVSIPSLYVISESVWFMTWYFSVTFVNTIILKVIENNHGDKKEKNTYMWILLALFVWVVYGNFAFGLDLRYFLFYSFFYMLGYNRKFEMKNLYILIGTILLMVLGVVAMSYLQNLPLWNIQDAKFPPSLKYGFVSMIFILIFKYFEKYYKSMPLIEHIGQNAIWYYFAQGISCSIANYFVLKIVINTWYLKWIVIFIINILITFIIAEILRILYTYIEKLIFFKRKE